MAKKKKQPGIPDSLKAVKDKEERITLTGIIIDLINYIEVSTGVSNYLANKKVLKPEVQARISIETSFARNIVLSYFKVTPSYLQEVVEEIHQDKEAFEDSVKKLADMLAPDQSILVTKNLDGEMQNIMGNRQLMFKDKR